MLSDVEWHDDCSFLGVIKRSLLVLTQRGQVIIFELIVFLLQTHRLLNLLDCLVGLGLEESRKLRVSALDGAVDKGTLDVNLIRAEVGVEKFMVIDVLLAIVLAQQVALPHTLGRQLSCNDLEPFHRFLLLRYRRSGSVPINLEGKHELQVLFAFWLLRCLQVQPPGLDLIEQQKQHQPK